MKHLAILAAASFAALASFTCPAQDAASAKIDPKAEEVALPAPAKTNSGPSVCSTAARCSGFSFVRSIMMYFLFSEPEEDHSSGCSVILDSTSW